MGIALLLMAVCAVVLGVLAIFSGFNQVVGMLIVLCGVVMFVGSAIVDAIVGTAADTTEKKPEREYHC